MEVIVKKNNGIQSIFSLGRDITLPRPIPSMKRTLCAHTPFLCCLQPYLK